MIINNFLNFPRQPRWPQEKLEEANFYSTLARQSTYVNEIDFTGGDIQLMKDLSKKHMATIKDAARKLTGSKKRAFEAQVLLII